MMPCRFKAKVISSSELPAKPTTSSERCSGEKPFFHSLLAGAHASDFSCEQWRPLSNLFHTLQTIKACIVVEYIGTSMCIYYVLVELLAKIFSILFYQAFNTFMSNVNFSSYPYNEKCILKKPM